MPRHSRLAVPVGPEDHVLGDAAAPMTVVLYGDYACRYTARAATNVELARRRLGRRLRSVFRHFPREDLAADAPLLAEAAHAAGAQGRFWEAHERLLDDATALGDPDGFARALGLDVDRFLADLQGRTFRAHVLAEMDGGLRSGVAATPTFFINGQRHIGSWEPMALFRALGGAPAFARSAHL